MAIPAYLLAGVSLLMGALLFIRIQAPAGFILWMPKLAAGALSPVWMLAGLIGLALGLLGGMPLAAAAGSIGMAIMGWYLWQVSKDTHSFAAAFGPDWMQCISTPAKSKLMKRRWTGLLLERKVNNACLEQNIAFWTIPGTHRELLCDIWKPAPDTEPSGLAVIFFHGSAWYFLDKDYGTRPFFSHLVAKGHVVIDVAYRLCPEVDAFDMVGDVKRAIAWMKANGSRYGVNPDRVVLAGASAGGHLAMLAAYAPQHPMMTPDEIKPFDLRVNGVISLYGPCDLRAVYTHTNQQNLVGLPKVNTGPDAAHAKKNNRDAGRLDILLGGHPSEVPVRYDLASPVTHVHPGCPPTLLIQGEQDLITPVAATRSFSKKLIQCGVPVISLEFPCTTHGFDLMLPQVSPSYQAALWHVDRFLALLQ